MATKKFTPLLGKKIRITVLDSCGRYPAPGQAGAFVVSDGFVSISLSAETEDGNEIATRKANGGFCVNEKMPDAFKYFTVEAEFCGIDPQIISMVSNAEPVRDWADDVAGFRIPEGEINKRFALEVWSGLSGIACEEGADEAGGYTLLPHLNGGTLGDLEWNGEDAINAKLTGAYTRGGNAWGAGPYPVLYDTSGAPALLRDPVDPYDHLMMIETGLASPPIALDPQPMVIGGTSTTSTSTSTSTSTTSQAA